MSRENREDKKVKINYFPPTRSPRPRQKDVPVVIPKDVQDAEVETQLSVYLKHAKISTAAFSRALGVTEKSVIGWRRGENCPSLMAAYEMERITKGAIPMESWLAIPDAKARVAEMRAKQPEGLRRIPPQPAGGYGAPHSVKGPEDVEDFDLEGRPIERNIHNTRKIKRGGR